MSAETKTDALSIVRLDLGSEAHDFEDIASIQSELAVAFQLLAAGERESSTGFLISAYKAETFREFIRQGGLILGARHNVSGRLSGYLLGNSGKTFLANHPTTQLHWDDDRSEEQYGLIYASGNFTYLDQIGVPRALHGTGVAQQLHERFLALATRPIVAAVVQEPIRNTRSTVFFKKLGYDQIGTFFTEELKGLQGVRSAVLALPEATPSP